MGEVIQLNQPDVTYFMGDNQEVSGVGHTHVDVSIHKVEGDIVFQIWDDSSVEVKRFDRSNVNQMLLAWLLVDDPQLVDSVIKG